MTVEQCWELSLAELPTCTSRIGALGSVKLSVFARWCRLSSDRPAEPVHFSSASAKAVPLVPYWGGSSLETSPSKLPCTRAPHTSSLPLIGIPMAFCTPHTHCLSQSQHAASSSSMLALPCRDTARALPMPEQGPCMTSGTGHKRCTAAGVILPDMPKIRSKRSHAKGLHSSLLLSLIFSKGAEVNSTNRQALTVRWLVDLRQSV